MDWNQLWENRSPPTIRYIWLYVMQKSGRNKRKTIDFQCDVSAIKLELFITNFAVNIQMLLCRCLKLIWEIIWEKISEKYCWLHRNPLVPFNEREMEDSTRNCHTNQSMIFWIWKMYNDDNRNIDGTKTHRNIRDSMASCTKWYESFLKFHHIHKMEIHIRASVFTWQTQHFSPTQHNKKKK